MIGVVPCISVPVGAQSNVNLESVPSLTSDFGVSTNENKNLHVDTASVINPNALHQVIRKTITRKYFTC